MGFTSEPQVRSFSFRPRTSSCGQLVSHRIITKKAIHKTLQKISDDSDVSGESIYSPINLGPSAKNIIIYLDMNKLLIIVLLIVLGMSTRLHHLGNSPCYRFDEGPKGHKCKNSNDCDGRRTCSPFGWCQGTAWSRWLFVIIDVLIDFAGGVISGYLIVKKLGFCFVSPCIVHAKH